MKQIGYGIPGCGEMAFDYRKGIKAEFEAREILKQQGFYVSRCSGHPSPPDLFAARKGDFRLVMVRHSRFPIPDAHAVSIIYAEDLDRFRRYGWIASIRFECWIHAPPWDWSWYEVHPGGIRRIWQEWETLGEAGVLDEADFVDGTWEDAVDTGVGSISIEWIPTSRPLTEERVPSGIRDEDGIVGQGGDSETGEGIPDNALMTDEGDHSGIPSDTIGMVPAETGDVAKISSIRNDRCTDSLLSPCEEMPSGIPSEITRTPLVETGDSIKASRHRNDQIPNDTALPGEEHVQSRVVNHA